MSVQFVRIEDTNSALLSNVAVDVFDHQIDPDFLQIFVRSPEHFLAVAVEAGAVIGQVRAILHLQPDRSPDLYLDNLGVSPAFHRRGVASKLMEMASDWGRANRATDIWLATETDNVEGIAFYRALGLEQSEVVMFANFKDDPGGVEN